MNETLITNWNNIVKADDIVYHLGDFGLKPENELFAIRKRLNGTIHLIKGNHDRNEKLLSTFASVSNYRKLHIQQGRPDFILFHYPIFEWDGYFHGNIHLYGHTHNNQQNPILMNARPNCLDVGVDSNYFRPVSVEEVFLKIKK